MNGRRLIGAGLVVEWIFVCVGVALFVAYQIAYVQTGVNVQWKVWQEWVIYLALAVRGVRRVLKVDRPLLRGYC